MASYPHPVGLTADLIDQIARHGTVSKVVAGAIGLYHDDPALLEEAFLNALNAPEDTSAFKRTTIRADAQAVAALKQAAKRIDIPFEALVRIILRHYLKLAP